MARASLESIYTADGAINGRLPNTTPVDPDRIYQKPFFKGGAEDKFRKSGVGKFFMGEQRPLQTEVSASDVRVGGSTETTKRGLFGRREKLAPGEIQEFVPDIDRVKPALMKWTVDHAISVLGLYPNAEGPGYQSDLRYQWEFAKSIVKFTTDGRIDREKSTKDLALKMKQDPKLYNDIMLWIEHEATLQAYALDIMSGREKKEIASENILDPNKPGKQNLRGYVNESKAVLAGYGLEGTAVVVLNILNLAAIATQNPNLVQTMHNITATGNNAALVGAIVAGGALLGVSAGRLAINKFVSAFREHNEMPHLMKQLATGVEIIQNDPALKEYLQKQYGIDVSQLQIGGNGLKIAEEGLSSATIRRTQMDFESNVRLREMFLIDMIDLDRRSTNAFNRCFDEVHGITAEFITRAIAVGGVNEFVANQTGAIYHRDWLLKFDDLRRSQSIGLEVANLEKLQELYLLAGTLLLQERANKRYRDSGALAVDMKRGDDHELDKDKEDLADAKDLWVRKGKNTSNGEVAMEDGEKRKKAKEKANEDSERAGHLIDGKPAEGLTEAKIGLKEELGVMQAPTAGEVTASTSGVLERADSANKMYSEIYALLFATQGALADEVRKNPSITTIDKTLAKLFVLIQGTGGLNEALEKLANNDEAARNQFKTDETDFRAKNFSGTNPEKQRQDAISRAQKICDDKIESNSRARTGLEKQKKDIEDLLSAIQAKREELVKAYQAVEGGRSELTHVRGLTQTMKKAFIAVGTDSGTTRLQADDLRKYGTSGYLMDNLFATLTTVCVGPITRPWPPTEDNTFEHQMVILHAAAEAVALEQYADLHKDPTGVHAQLLDPGQGNLTPEELIILTPYEVHDRVATNLGWSIGAYDPTNMGEIRNACATEKNRYIARKDALAKVIVRQQLVRGNSEEQVKKVEEECDKNMHKLELIRHYVEDWGTVFCRAPEMCQTQNLHKYADGATVAASTHITTETERAKYLASERSSPFSRGFLEFLRDTFQYHEGMKNTVSGTDGSAAQVTRPEIDSRDKEILLAMLLEVLGTDPEKTIANMIAISFPGFDDVHNGMISREDLSFGQVMELIEYRNNPYITPPTNATVLTGSIPVRPGEMREVLKAVSGGVAKAMLGSGIV